MRIGVFGGSFDPPHAAHLIAANQARSQFKLDRILWVPTFHPPHKIPPIESFQHRLGMVKTLITGHPGSEVLDIESTLPQPSYTLNTLWALKSKLGEGHSWFLIMGADNWAIFPKWHEPQAVLQEAEILLYPRQGFILRDLPERVQVLESPEVPYASRDFREMAAKLPDQALSFLPPLVAHYIRRHQLYGVTRKTSP